MAQSNTPGMRPCLKTIICAQAMKACSDGLCWSSEQRNKIFCEDQNIPDTTEEGGARH